MILRNGKLPPYFPSEGKGDEVFSLFSIVAKWHIVSGVHWIGFEKSLSKYHWCFYQQWKENGKLHLPSPLKGNRKICGWALIKDRMAGDGTYIVWSLEKGVNQPMPNCRTNAHLITPLSPLSIRTQLVLFQFPLKNHQLFKLFPSHLLTDLWILMSYFLKHQTKWSFHVPFLLKDGKFRKGVWRTILISGQNDTIL